MIVFCNLIHCFATFSLAFPSSLLKLSSSVLRDEHNFWEERTRGRTGGGIKYSKYAHKQNARSQTDTAFSCEKKVKRKRYVGFYKGEFAPEKICQIAVCTPSASSCL